MASDQRRPGLSNVILFARLGCHMIAHLDNGTWTAKSVFCVGKARVRNCF
jgi:hypothetical protein